MFIFASRILDAVSPDRYPRARCPTAYMEFSFIFLSVCAGSFSIGLVI
jgi:hypothetical protein